MIRRFRKKEDWSLSQEREFIEDLFNKRIHVFVAVYALIVAGTISAKQFEDKVFVLLTGSLLTFVIGISLYRACHKLILILKLLHRTKQHPVRSIGRYARKYDWPLSISVNHLSGIVLPIAAFLFLIAWLSITVWRA